MTDDLFIGASGQIDIDKMVQQARAWLGWVGYQVGVRELVAMELGKDDGGVRAQGNLDSAITISLENFEPRLRVTITRFETEIVPGFPGITEPFTIGVSVWVGALAFERALAGCIATAVASESGTKIWDSEHKWSDVEINDVQSFIENVRKKYSQL